MADRANLYYKIGSLVDIPFFNVEESILIKRMGETETFEDVLEVARDLYEYCKQPEKEQEKVATKQNTESNAGGGEEPDDKPVDETLDESKPQQSPVDSYSPLTTMRILMRIYPVILVERLMERNLRFVQQIILRIRFVI